MLLGGKEIREPASWLLGFAAVTVALAGVRNIVNISFYESPYFISILLGFVVHELAHREVSRRYGLRSEFIANTNGLLITMLSGFIPNIVILMPGYVKTVIYRWEAPERARKAILWSVAAGPLSNIILSILSIIVFYIEIAKPYPYLHALTAYSAWINAWIAFFNLIPLHPLDGSKIFMRDKKLWGAMFILSLLLLAMSGASF